MKRSSSLGSVAKFGSISGSVATSGSFQGSDELARNVSVSRISAVRWVTAMRAASIAAWKQSEGVLAATTGSGDSPCRP